MEWTPNQPEKEYLFVERKSAEIQALLLEAPLYQKYGLIKVRPAVIGEKVTTVLENGLVETSGNTAGPDDFIVTNPGGEIYIISKEKLEQRYDPTDESGIYSAKGHCKAIHNPYDKNIEILASWGERQVGDSDCLIADTCDENGVLDGEPYIIEHKAFLDTYKQVEN